MIPSRQRLLPKREETLRLLANNVIGLRFHSYIHDQ